MLLSRVTSAFFFFISPRFLFWGGGVVGGWGEYAAASDKNCTEIASVH